MSKMARAALASHRTMHGLKSHTEIIWEKLDVAQNLDNSEQEKSNSIYSAINHNILSQEKRKPGLRRSWGLVL